MAQEVVVRTWCDRHLANGEKIEGETIAPIILGNGTGPRALELCADCQTSTVAPLLKLLEEYGRNVKRGGGRPPKDKAAGAAGERVTSEATRRGIACPVCGLIRAGRSGLSKHMEAQHGGTLPAWETEHGNGKSVEGQPLTVTCPTCSQRFTGNAALGKHRQGAHGYAP